MELNHNPIPSNFPFPFTPYGIQKDLMSKVYEAMERGKIGIFESPTGTVGWHVLITNWRYKICRFWTACCILCRASLWAWYALLWNGCKTSKRGRRPNWRSCWDRLMRNKVKEEAQLQLTSKTNPLLIFFKFFYLYVHN